MAYESPDLVVFQGRWFSPELNELGIRWTPWKTIEEWEYIAMKEHIHEGSNYQVRILKQIHIEGYGVNFNYEHPEISVNPGL